MEFFSTFGNWCGGPGFFHGAGSGWVGFMPFHFGGIFQLLIIGLIIYFTVRMITKSATTNGAETPKDILKRRYAAGEIDKQTYQNMKNELQN